MELKEVIEQVTEKQGEHRYSWLRYRAYGIAKSYAGLQVIDDVENEGYIAVKKAAESVDPDHDGAVVYLRKAAEWGMHGYLKKWRTSQKEITKNKTGIATPPLDITLESQRDPTAYSVIRKMRRQAVRDAVARLSPEGQALYVLRVKEQRTWPEIAVALEQSERTCTRHWQAVLDSLRPELSAWVIESDD